VGKIAALWSLFKAGEQVEDPAKWKGHQITANLVGGVLLAAANVAKAFGYELPVDEHTANTIGAGVLAAVNVVLTITTSRHVGV
jgi:uncharacterized membrane protein